jgi:hypothetical protein
VPGAQVPEQAPPLHKFVHAVSFSHVAVALHISGVKPSHCLVAGVHTPEQTPAAHR